jgi:hypothetical protein
MARGDGARGETAVLHGRWGGERVCNTVVRNRAPRSLKESPPLLKRNVRTILSYTHLRSRSVSVHS